MVVRADFATRRMRIPSALLVVLLSSTAIPRHILRTFLVPDLCLVRSPPHHLFGTNTDAAGAPPAHSKIFDSHEGAPRAKERARAASKPRYSMLNWRDPQGLTNDNIAPFLEDVALQSRTQLKIRL